MPFSLIEQRTTNTASTVDWLSASKDMTISAFDPVVLTSVPFVGPSEQGVQERLFGTHLRETIETVKDWVSRK